VIRLPASLRFNRREKIAATAIGLAVAALFFWMLEFWSREGLFAEAVFFRREGVSRAVIGPGGYVAVYMNGPELPLGWPKPSYEGKRWIRLDWSFGMSSSRSGSEPWLIRYEISAGLSRSVSRSWADPTAGIAIAEQLARWPYPWLDPIRGNLFRGEPSGVVVRPWVLAWGLAWAVPRSLTIGLGAGLSYLAYRELRARKRRRAGVCVQCEYPVAGLSVCPECGWAVQGAVEMVRAGG
jgi:hypothetical protein